GADVNAHSRHFQFGALKEASGGALMERAEGGMTALQYAAREGNVETGKVLIDASADVNALEPQHNFTSMLIAIYNGKYDFASLLLDHGAKVNDGSLYLAIELRNMDTYSNHPNPPETDRTLTATDIIKKLLIAARIQTRFSTRSRRRSRRREPWSYRPAQRRSI